MCGMLLQNLHAELGGFLTNDAKDCTGIDGGHVWGVHLQLTENYKAIRWPRADAPQRTRAAPQIMSMKGTTVRFHLLFLWNYRSDWPVPKTDTRRCTG
mmetsp:Transcript_75979/g.222731  ORF Transcript_75979/g.222731 Transcript_75979/m.222731 type:complete len:98 (+) Transcript_75979:646-939(+)